MDMHMPHTSRLCHLCTGCMTSVLGPGRSASQRDWWLPEEHGCHGEARHIEPKEQIGDLCVITNDALC